MRGVEHQQARLCRYVWLEHRVPLEHPLRAIRPRVETALAGLGEGFAGRYAATGRPSMPPERLWRALLLQSRYSLRSERLLREQRDYNLLCRWCVGLNRDAAGWEPSSCSQKRERLLAGEGAHAFLAPVLAPARERPVLSSAHLTVAGTWLEAWASLKRCKPKAAAPAEAPEDSGNPRSDLRGETRRHATHAATTDPDARLDKKAKGQAATLGSRGQVLLENRNGLIVETPLTQAPGTAEREPALEMAAELPGSQRGTLGGDKAYDTPDLVAELRIGKVTPQVAQNTTGRKRAIAGRTTRHAG